MKPRAGMFNRERKLARICLQGWILVVLLLAQGCSSNSIFGESATPEQPTPAPTETPTSPAGFTPPAGATTTPGGPLTLRVWVPPQFDPAEDTAAAILLRARLAEFTRQRPRVTIDVRVKAMLGPGGLLDALTTSKAAAPQTAPDLIALPRDLLETAALKGLLTPYSPSAYVEQEKDWYDYARDLARLQDSVYGLPFAGDALAYVYRPTQFTAPPETWENMLQQPNSLLFNASDPQALLTLANYQASGGQVRDEQGKPAINGILLTEVLTYYVRALGAGAIPVDIAQIQNDDQAWNTFQDASAPGVITWISRFLGGDGGDPMSGLDLTPLPTPGGQPQTVANGWVWALASPDAERQRVAVELARFLSDRAFLAEWTESASYLPPHTGALENWENKEIGQVLDRIARSAQILPPGDIMAALSGPLRQATLAVLAGQSDPATAAQQAAAGLTGP